MGRIFNFSAGPATLPLEVLEQAQSELVDWNGRGVSVMEVSHRSKAFIRIAEQAEADVRELLGVPGDYAVLFLQGGATQQFAQIPMNLAGPDQTVDYLVTGQWSKKASGEAKPIRKVNVIADGAAGNYTDVPERSAWKLTPGAAYVHYCPNETIGGLEFHHVPGRCAEIRPDLCRRAEEHRASWPGADDHQAGPDGAGARDGPEHTALLGPGERGLDAQYATDFLLVLRGAGL
jgi:phosphoserine aminotransferase